MREYLAILCFSLCFSIQTLAQIVDDDICAKYSNVLKINVQLPPQVEIDGKSPIKLGKSAVLHAKSKEKVNYLWSTGATSSVIKVEPNFTTTYTVTVSKSIGCTATAQFTVVVLPPDADNNGSILQFTARRRDLKSQLDWLSNTGERNDYFVVERSADSLHFLPILRRDGRGEAEITHHFKDFDHQPFVGDNFYRLKLVMLDGSVKYSQVEKVMFPPAIDDISVFPNPATDKIFVNLSSLAGKWVDIYLVNEDSRIIEPRRVLANREMYEIDATFLPSAMYFLVVQPEGERSRVLKVVVIRQ